MTALAYLPETDRAAVSATALTRTYGEGGSAVHALRGVTLEIPAGEFTAVMGPSGSGKSTLMHLLAGLDTPDAGAVHIAGEDITRMSDRELTRLRRKHIGFVFQSFNLLPTLSAVENVTLPLAIAGRKPAPEVVAALMERMGLSERADHKPAQLSGGQQQRVAIARALVNEPTLLLADEPTGNLDTKTSIEIMQLITRLNREQGITVIMVTHEDDIAAYANRMLRFVDGHLASDMPVTHEDAVQPVSGRRKAKAEDVSHVL